MTRASTNAAGRDELFASIAYEVRRLLLSQGREGPVHDERSRIVVDLGFDAVLCKTRRAIEEQGLRVIARIDDVWHGRTDDSLRCASLEAWSPELWRQTRLHDVPLETILVTTFTIYELTESETAVEAAEGFIQEIEGRDEDALAAFVDHERERVACVLVRLQHASIHDCR